MCRWQIETRPNRVIPHAIINEKFVTIDLREICALPCQSVEIDRLNSIHLDVKHPKLNLIKIEMSLHGLVLAQNPFLLFLTLIHTFIYLFKICLFILLTFKNMF